MLSKDAVQATAFARILLNRYLSSPGVDLPVLCITSRRRAGLSDRLALPALGAGSRSANAAQASPKAFFRSESQFAYRSRSGLAGPARPEPTVRRSAPV